MEQMLPNLHTNKERQNNNKQYFVEVLKWHVGNTWDVGLDMSLFFFFGTINGIKTLRIEDVGYDLAWQKQLHSGCCEY